MQGVSFLRLRTEIRAFLYHLFPDLLIHGKLQSMLPDGSPGGALLKFKPFRM